MLQDIRASRHTEIDALNGYIMRTAEQISIDVPLNRMIYGLVCRTSERPGILGITATLVTDG